MDKKLHLLIGSAILGLSGLLILGLLVSWWAALGVFLCQWGQNLENKLKFDGLVDVLDKFVSKFTKKI